MENPTENTPLLKRDIERYITPQLELPCRHRGDGGRPCSPRSLSRKGTDKPYALDQTHIYVRAESENTEAVRDEIVNLVLATHALTSAPAPVVAAPVESSAVEPVIG